MRLWGPERGPTPARELDDGRSDKRGNAPIERPSSESGATRGLISRMRAKTARRVVTTSVTAQRRCVRLTLRNMKEDQEHRRRTGLGALREALRFPTAARTGARARFGRPAEHEAEARRVGEALPSGLKRYDVGHLLW